LQDAARKWIENGALAQLREAAQRMMDEAPIVEEARLALAQMSEPLRRMQADLAAQSAPMLEAARIGAAMGGYNHDAALVASNLARTRVANSVPRATPRMPAVHRSSPPAESPTNAELRLASARIAELEAVVMALQLRIREREIADALDDASTRPWNEDDYLGSLN
jgi:hypothetical protein